LTNTPENEQLSALSSLLESAGLTAKDFVQNISVLANAKKENIEKQKKLATEGKIFLNKEFIIPARTDVYIYQDNRTKNKNYYIRIWEPKTRKHFSQSLKTNIREIAFTRANEIYLNRVGRLNFGLNNKSITANELVSKYSQLRQKDKEQEIWLAFSPIKSNYFNFMIQKATELGVTKFVPIISERTIVRKVNNERLNKIIIESCEQSNRINIPSIEKPQSLDKFLSNNSDINLIFGDLNTNNKKIKISNSKPNCLLIGPEGDYSAGEIKKILNFKGSQSIKLSDNILRSETAVISALSVINYLQN